MTESVVGQLKTLLADQDRAVMALTKAIYDGAGPGMVSFVTSKHIARAVLSALHGLAEQPEQVADGDESKAWHKRRLIEFARAVDDRLGSVVVGTAEVEADQVWLARAAVRLAREVLDGKCAAPNEWVEVVRANERQQVQAELLEQLCGALGEPLETPADHPGEPPYRMTWDRALGLVRGTVQVWADLLSRAEVADAAWLNGYRGRAAGPAVPVITPDGTGLDAGGVMRRLDQEISRSRDVIARMDIGPADEDRAVEIGAKARYLASTVSAEPDWDRQTARAKDSYRDQVRPAVVAVLAAPRKVPNG